MIRYEPGTWGVWFGLTCYGSVFPKSFCVAFPCSLCCGVLHLLISKGVIPLSRFERDSEAVGSSVLGGFTFILGFLIVFRSQQAYSRWWEGGTLLQQIRGEWFNAFSSLVAFCNPAEERKATVHEFQHHLVRLVSLLYGSALEQVTTMERAIFEMIDLDGFPVEHLQFITGAHDRVEIVLQWLQKLIVDSEADGTIKIAPPILSRVYNQLGNGIVNLNNARKITEFPIPFPLAQMVAFGLVCHWWMTLYIAVVYVESATWGCLVCFIVVNAFWSINYISMELEMPFGDDLNDLPLQEMQKDFNRSLISLLQPYSLIPPKFKLESWHGELRTSKVDFETYIDQLSDAACLKPSTGRCSHLPRRPKIVHQKRHKAGRVGSAGLGPLLPRYSLQELQSEKLNSSTCMSWQVWSTKPMKEGGEDGKDDWTTEGSRASDPTHLFASQVSAHSDGSKQHAVGRLSFQNGPKKEVLEHGDIEIKMPGDVISSQAGSEGIVRERSRASISINQKLSDSDASLIRIGMRLEEQILQIARDLRDVKEWNLGSRIPLPSSERLPGHDSRRLIDSTRMESRNIDANTSCWSSWR